MAFTTTDTTTRGPLAETARVLAPWVTIAVALAATATTLLAMGWFGGDDDDNAQVCDRCGMEYGHFHCCECGTDNDYECTCR